MKNGDYREYVKGLTKQELEQLILGTDFTPPILTRDEPTYSRPQILWGMNAVYRDSDSEVSFEESENFVNDIMNAIEGYRWKIFYNYDWIRFEIKKLSFYWAFIILLLAIIGCIYSVWTTINAILYFI